LSDMDKILQGLQLANGVMGIAVNYQTYQNHRGQNEARERLARGEQTQAEAQDYLAKGLTMSDSPTENAIQTRIKRAEGEGFDTKYWSAPQSKEKPVELFTAETVGPDGKPATGVFEKRPGITIPKPPSAQENAATAAAKPKNYDERVKALTAPERQRFDSASMGLQSVKDMSTALGAGENTFSVWGDNNFTEASKRFEEAIGRMQSGGAINDEEAARFRGMAPTFRDSPEMQKTKMDNLYKEMSLRVSNLGFDPDEVLAKRASVKIPGTDSNGPKPGDVVDGYKFNGGDPADKNNWSKK
jgi:hypothetical protein